MSELELRDQRVPTPAEYALLHLAARKRATAALWRVHDSLDVVDELPAHDPELERAAAAALLRLIPAEPQSITARRRTVLLQAVTPRG